MPGPLGSLVWTDPAGMQAILAFLTEWLPEARDGWDWCVQDLLEHLEHGRTRLSARLRCARLPGRRWAG